MAKSRNKRKKKNSKVEGKKKMMKNRIDLFNKVYLRYMEKSYPVLARFQKLVSLDHIKVSFIRKAALQMALDMKMREAVERAKVNMLNKIEDEESETRNTEEIQS